MKVILIDDVKNVGKKNQVIDVADGYAKNFLLKKKLAVMYTQDSAKHLEATLADLQEKENIAIAKANELKAQIEKVVINLSLKTNNGHAFGSISLKQVIDALKNEHNIVVDKYMFELEVKGLGLGEHFLKVNLYKKIFAKLQVCVKGI